MLEEGNILGISHLMTPQNSMSIVYTHWKPLHILFKWIAGQNFMQSLLRGAHKYSSPSLPAPCHLQVYISTFSWSPNYHMQFLGHSNAGYSLSNYHIEFKHFSNHSLDISSKSTVAVTKLVVYFSRSHS